jgi:hypothetical protein
MSTSQLPILPDAVATYPSSTSNPRHAAADPSGNPRRTAKEKLPKTKPAQRHEANGAVDEARITLLVDCFEASHNSGSIQFDTQHLPANVTGTPEHHERLSHVSSCHTACRHGGAALQYLVA